MSAPFDSDGDTDILPSRTCGNRKDMHATNTFEKSDAVGLAALAAPVWGEAVTLTIPKQAIVAVSFRLA